MKKANRSPNRHRGVSFRTRAARGGANGRVMWRWVVIGGASLVCCALIAVRNGAEQVDSGWAVASPSPIGASQAPTPEQQLVIRHVLEQTQPEPWLRKPSSSQAAQSTTEAKPTTGPRPAARPQAADVWRPVSEPATEPLLEDWTLPESSPATIGPSAAQKNSSAKSGNQIEFDCNGAPHVVETPRISRLPGRVSPSPVLSLPESVNAPHSDDESDCSGPQLDVSGRQTTEPEDAADVQEQPAEIKSQP